MQINAKICPVGAVYICGRIFVTLAQFLYLSSNPIDFEKNQTISKGIDRSNPIDFEKKIRLSVREK